MKIDSASYSLSASHVAASRDESQESLRLWLGERRPGPAAGAQPGPSSTVALSAAARAALAASPQPAPGAAPAAADEPVADATDAAAQDPYLQLLISVIEMLSGKHIRILSTQGMRQPSPVPAPAATGPLPAPARTSGFGLEYDYHSVHEEFAQTQVSARGVIKTADGREISFRLDLSMTYSYREENALSLRAGDAVRKDPLVLNFNGAAARLSDRRFAFDLAGTGSKADIALLGGGSGYLAIDRNGNGVIDSGRELFGPATNSGFGELAALDSDGNGWIDGNDAAYADLRVWTPDPEGEGRLETLLQRKVGAIAVGSVASPFELRGPGNRDLGAIAATGIFLGEDGSVGSVQEIDLAV